MYSFTCFCHLQGEISVLQNGVAASRQQMAAYAQLDAERHNLKRHIIAMDAEMFALRQQLAEAAGGGATAEENDRTEGLRGRLQSLQQEVIAKVRIGVQFSRACLRDVRCRQQSCCRRGAGVGDAATEDGKS